MTTFTFNNATYTTNGKGYYYKEDQNGKIRIKATEFEEAFERACEERKNEEAIQEATENAQKSTENTNATKSPTTSKSTKKSKRKPKKNAFFTAVVDDGATEITLTEKQVIFIETIPNDDFYQNGLESGIWIDNFCDTISDTMNPMAVGAMVSTLREKNLIRVGESRMNGKKCRFFEFTELGKIVAQQIGLV